MAERPNNALDKTRDLQRKLYRAAKRSPNRRFHALYDRVLRRDVLRRAWLDVRANQGAPGVDALTIADIEASGVEEFLDDLQSQLADGIYRLQPVRRVWIPKPGKAELRPLGVTAVGEPCIAGNQQAGRGRHGQGSAVRHLRAAYSQAVRTDEAQVMPARLPRKNAFPTEPSALQGFCYVKRHVRKCSQVGSHTGYV